MTPSLFKQYLTSSIDAIREYQARWSAFSSDASMNVDEDVLRSAFEEFITRLSDSYPFFHPSYIGQMLKPPHPVAMLAYFTAMQINPNNHALDGGPATSEMEKEVVAALAKMIGYEQHLGHLTSSGTIANLEALWIAREIHPEKFIVYSQQSHYTHRRMCDVLRAPHREIASDMQGRIDMNALEEMLQSVSIGTVVATLGTTGLGALDSINDLLALQKRYEFRIHVDAAYGGFYTLLAHDDHPIIDPTQFTLLSQCDSLVIDPHKHGLQPYGCGCVLFRDPTVGKFYKHDSPYTYFTSEELHLGEISLECSRAGAAAAALWFTLQCIPLESERGLGAILRRCRSSALLFSKRLKESTTLRLLLDPALDIVAFFPRCSSQRAADISAKSHDLFSKAMNHSHAPIYLSKLKVDSALLSVHYPEIIIDEKQTTILRSVMMKPEEYDHVERLVDALEKLC